MACCDLWSVVLCYTKLLVSNVIGLHKGLTEFPTIRGQLAHYAKFPVYGPALAATGVLSPLAQTAQAHRVKIQRGASFVAGLILTAIAAELHYGPSGSK
jgi:hypothetical protein